MNSHTLNKANLLSLVLTKVLFTLLIFMQWSSYSQIQIYLLMTTTLFIIIVICGVTILFDKINVKKIQNILQVLSLIQIAVLTEVIIVVRKDLQLAIIIPLFFSDQIDEIVFNIYFRFLRQIYLVIRFSIDSFNYLDLLLLSIQILIQLYLGKQKNISLLKYRNQSITYANLQKQGDITSQKITIREDNSAINEKFDIPSKRLSILKDPESDVNFTNIIQYFPEGVAIIGYQDDFKPYIKFQNSSISKLINVAIDGNLIKEIGKLNKLDRIKSSKVSDENEQEIIKDSFQTFKSFAYDAQFEHQFLRQDRLTLFNAQRSSNQLRGSTNLRATQLDNIKSGKKFSYFNASSEIDLMKAFYDTDNLFERVLYLAAVTLFKQNSNSVKDDQLTLFSILNGYIRVGSQEVEQNVDQMEEKKEERCIEIKVFLSKTKKPSLLLLARDVTHRDYIKLLKDQSKAKQNSLNFVSHEYRTPLNCIITMLENCEEDFQNKQIGDQTCKQIQTALQNCYYILNLSNDLLDLAQMKVGKFQLQKTNFFLDSLLMKCISLFQPLADKKKIKLHAVYPEHYIGQICHDENRIKQIIINLLGNAFKFTIEGQITIEVKMIGKDAIRILVSDTGIGIRDQDKGKLMDAFGKIESDENKKLNRQGVGLGLLISNMIARSLNNKSIGLQFFSTHNQGSTFYFDIQHEITQRLSSNQLQSLNVLPQESEQSSDSFRLSQNNLENIQKVYVENYRKNKDKKEKCQKKQCNCSDILIVDDIQFNIEALILILNKFGFKRIDFVICGQFAIDKVQDKLHCDCCKFYKLIFMDIEMPGLDGFQTFNEIATILSVETHHTKIIACSGYSSQAEKEKAIQIGMHGYLEKPLKKKELEKILQLI